MCKTAFISLLNFCPLPLICFYSRVAQVNMASEDFLGAGIETRRCRAGAEGCVLGVPCLHVHSSLNFWVWACAAVESNMLCTFCFFTAQLKAAEDDLFGMRLSCLSGLCSETSVFRICMIPLTVETEFWNAFCSSTICRLNVFRYQVWFLTFFFLFWGDMDV